MRWPWVSRHRLDGFRRLAQKSAKRLAAAENSAKFMRSQLEACQLERADLQLKLLRAGFGINPFFELVEAQARAAAGGVAPVTAPEQPRTPDLPLGASPERVLEHFTREGLEIYGPGNMRAIKTHIERRQAEYYAGRTLPFAPSPEEAAAAARVAADLEAAIEEGRAGSKD